MSSLDGLPQTGPISLIAEFTARPGEAERIAALLAGLRDAVRREPGNVAFDCYRRHDASDKFVVYEIYCDKAAFTSHIGADYGAEFNSTLETLIVEPHSVLTFLTPLDAA